MAHFRVIVREPDGLERLVLATEDQVITESDILWDERVEGGNPPQELLDKATVEDAKRKANKEGAEQAKKSARDAALTRLLSSNDKDTEDLLILLGFK